MQQVAAILEAMRAKYPEKFAGENEIFRSIHPGARLFVGTACAEPQYLVQRLVRYVECNPKAFFDAEVLHLWTLGAAPYTSIKFSSNFRLNSFFVSGDTRRAINLAMADYTPMFVFQIPALFDRGLVSVDVALVQTSLPDEHGYVSLGVSVDIMKAALRTAKVIIAQVNSNMPRVHGDGFLNIKDIKYILPYDEPLLEFDEQVSDEVTQRIGKYVARLVQDGDTIQVGYGGLPNAILAHLGDKKHLGVHTDLLSDGIVDLMKRGVIDNSQKSVNRGKTIASLCMAKQPTYAFINDNPSVELRTIDYTNNPMVIAQQSGMTAINGALEIDLTGQVTAESIGSYFYSGIGGRADFMRGAVLAPHGKAILAIQSTAQEGQVSRVVPFLKEGAGITLNRGDVHYVVTEYGIAYLHGKNIRERAMALIPIAHPKFRQWLVDEARQLHLIYPDQKIIEGVGGEYPEEVETHGATNKGLDIFLRPVRISDESLLKDFFYSLSETSIYRRFISTRRDMPHERLQPFVIIDYTREMAILAIIQKEHGEEVAGVGWYYISEKSHIAELAFAVKDTYQNQGIGTLLLSYMTQLARKQGLLGLIAEVLVENRAMRHIFDKAGYKTEKASAEMVEIRLMF